MMLMHINHYNLFEYFCFSDAQFLKNYHGTNEESVFEWNFKPADYKIIPDQSSFKIGASWIEILIKKALEFNSGMIFILRQ